MVLFFRYGESFVVEYEYEWVDLKNVWKNDVKKFFFVVYIFWFKYVYSNL